MDGQQHHQSRLLRLPVEIQLIVYEYTVVDDEPLLLNCPCDSSYADGKEWAEDQRRWKEGEKQRPVQPGLTRTCTAIRAMTIDTFYERNTFRAHYCFNTDVASALEWLQCIGRKNRRSLRNFFFYDANPGFDEIWPLDLMRLQRGEFRDMGGAILTSHSEETLHIDDHICHRGSFINDDGDGHLESVARLFEVLALQEWEEPGANASAAVHASEGKSYEGVESKTWCH